MRQKRSVHRYSGYWHRCKHHRRKFHRMWLPSRRAMQVGLLHMVTSAIAWIGNYVQPSQRRLKMSEVTVNHNETKLYMWYHHQWWLITYYPWWSISDKPFQPLWAARQIRYQKSWTHCSMKCAVDWQRIPMKLKTGRRYEITAGRIIIIITHRCLYAGISQVCTPWILVRITLETLNCIICGCEHLIYQRNARNSKLSSIMQLCRLE